MERPAVGAPTELFVLVVWRLWDVSMSEQRNLDREGMLRLTGSALAGASTIDGIGSIVRKAVRDLIGQRPDREGLLAVRKDDELTVVAASSGGLAPSRELAG